MMLNQKYKKSSIFSTFSSFSIHVSITLGKQRFSSKDRQRSSLASDKSILLATSDRRVVMYSVENLSFNL